MKAQKLNLLKSDTGSTMRLMCCDNKRDEMRLTIESKNLVDITSIEDGKSAVSICLNEDTAQHVISFLMDFIDQAEN